MQGDDARDRDGPRGRDAESKEPGATLDFETGGAFRGPLGDRVHSYLAGRQAESPPGPGDRIGRFRLLEQIGEGGMGEVFRGRDELLGREVAVKRLHPERGLSEAARARFFREARILAGLEHENICQVYDFVEEGDDEFLVLELIRGTSLSELSAGDLDDADRWSVARQITSALAAAHRRGIVHRDLKPANVLRQADSKVRVLDFGIARSLTAGGVVREPAAGGATGEPAPDPETWSAAITTHGQIIGTPRYMSPEQAAGDEVLPSSDMYSLGLLLHQLFADRPAGGDGTHSISTRLDPALRNLLVELLREEPERRPTANETLRRLERLSGRRRRRRLLLSAASVVALLVVGSWLWGQRAAQPLLAPGQVGRVAILPVENATGDPALDWVELGVPELVGQSLASVEGIETVPFEDLEAVGLSVRSAQHTSEEIRRLTRAVGAQLVVQVRLTDAGSRLDLAYQVLSGAGSTGRNRFLVADPMQAASELAARLADRIRPDAAFAGLADRLSENATANALFARGIHAKRTQGYEMCTHYFHVASDIDPGFWQARIQLARCLTVVGRRDEALAIVGGLIDRGADGLAPSDEVEAAAMAQSGHILGGLADHRESIRRLDRAAEIYRRLGQTEERARAVSSTAYAYRQLWLWSDDEADRLAAIRAMEEAARLFLQVDRPAAEVRGLYYVAAAAQLRDELESATETLRRLVRLAEEVGEKHYLGLALIRFGMLADDPGEEESSFRRALAVSRSIQNYAVAATASRNLGLLYRRQGKLAQAESLFRQALELAERSKNVNIISPAHHNLSRVLITLGRSEEALGYLAAEIEAGRADKLTFGLQAEALAELGRWDEAVRAQEQSRTVQPDAWRPVDQEYLEEYRQRLDSNS